MAESTVFNAPVPDQPTDVLLLVENSQAMSYIWDDLRDRYLQRLMNKLHPAEPATGPLNVWVLESQPLQASSTTQPRRYHDPRRALNEVCLNYMPENRISSTRVDGAIEFLAGLASHNHTQGHSLHLIIVAVSTPIDNAESSLASEMNGAPKSSTWGELAEKLAQMNIYCHTLTTRAKEDMSALATLFNETLRLERTVEDLVSFPADSEVSLRFSTLPAPHSDHPSYGQANTPLRPGRIAMPPRRNTFPQDPGYPEQIAGDSMPQTSHSPEMDPPPSLVSQLQQVHGLTKRRSTVPSLNESRKKFSLPAAVAMGPVPPPYLPDTTIQQHAGLSASGGRVMSLSKVDRHARLQASPIDMQGRRHLAWSGRSSRIASPELLDPTGSPSSVGGYSDVSPTASYISSDVSSPITPGSVSEDYYGVHLQAPTSGLCGTPAIVDGGSSDPTWLQTSYVQGYITSTGHAMAPIAHGYYIPAAQGTSPPYYDTSLVGHGLDVYANPASQEIPPPAAGLEALPKPPANHTPLEAVPQAVTIPPPAPSEAPVTQPSPLPPPAPSTKKAKRKQEAAPVDDKDYIILDQQFADYGASINEEFVNMLKEKDAEKAKKVRERRASGTTEDMAASKDASSSSYAASTDVQGYLPGRGGNGDPATTAGPAASPSSMRMKSSSSPSGASPPDAAPAPANEKVYASLSSASQEIDGSYSASCYPLRANYAAPPSHQMVDPRFLPAIPSCMTVPSGTYPAYRQALNYPSQANASNSLTGWAG
ncbi:hypothetical protein BKA70DRAFT_1518061 [Coprinopsis sp. MPI-PUGE-AT-0042]|nr:hypothetical protein BKA70DRAFT_1518061 [Coprinopsis sp. MPI-PUGE-AT-0042]